MYRGGASSFSGLKLLLSIVITGNERNLNKNVDFDV